MKRCSHFIVGLLVMSVAAMPMMAKQILIGPANPGAEDGSDGWWVGASGKSYLLVDHTDPASDTSDFALGNTNLDGDNSAGWRSGNLSARAVAAGAKPITFSFTYKLVDEVKAGDNVLVQLRFFDKATNWISERDFVLGPIDKPVIVKPLKTFPIIRDLVTDVSWNYKINRMIPPFTPRPRDPDGHWHMQQADVDRVQEFRKCIECFLCQDVCHVLRTSQDGRALRSAKSVHALVII